MERATSESVRQRAGHRCEYCHLPEHVSVLQFHGDHIIARQHGGLDVLGNLALACPECNYRKGTNLTGIDPDTGEITPIFHPRKDRWADHVSLDGARIAGITPIGRTTAWLLEMNTTDRLRTRDLLLQLGAFE